MTSRSTYRVCPGWPADWINAWLAAVGATVLVPRMRLSWTNDALPLAILEHPDEDPAAALANGWPTIETLDAMPLSHNHGDSPPIGRKVPVETFAERVRATVQHSDAWTLTSSLTDLSVDKGEASHGPFDPPGPGTVKWLHHRLLKTHKYVKDPAQQLPASMNGTLAPVRTNGLGFDIVRLRDRTENAKSGDGPSVDPVVETLAFFGLALFPVRGDGIKTRLPRPRQRGWWVAEERGFIWPAWKQPLERHGIDALLDVWHTSWRRRRSQDSVRPGWNPDQAAWERLGVHAAWQAAEYQRASSSESNRGYGSERIGI